jgi:hypothetical protein
VKGGRRACGASEHVAVDAPAARGGVDRPSAWNEVNAPAARGGVDRPLAWNEVNPSGLRWTGFARDRERAFGAVRCVDA